MNERVFVVRAVDDNDGTWSVDVYLNQANAEARARERLDTITRWNGDVDRWERHDSEDAINFNPPEDSTGTWGSCDIWKSYLDVPTALSIDDTVYVVWVDRWEVETGVQMVYTTKEAAEAAVEATKAGIGGTFTRHDNINEPDVVIWNNIDSDDEIDREVGDNEVIIWERPVLDDGKPKGETDL